MKGTMNRPETPITSLFSRERVIAGITLVAIALHLVLRFVFEIEGTALIFSWPTIPLLVALVVGGIPLVAGLVIRLVRFEFSSDLLAGISIVTAVVLGEYLAGTLVVLMLSGGQALEAYAVRRASSALLALSRRMPSQAHRKQDGTVSDIPLEEIAVGELLVVFPHETCPVDAVVVEGHSTMNESYLTGEPYVLSKAVGSAVMSGAINGDGALTIRAEKTAVDSRYAKIMQVMRESEQSRPQLRRLGDQIGANLHTARRCHRPGRLGGEWRCPAIPGRAGSRHALPAAHRHPRGDHRLRFPGGPTWHYHQRPSRAGKDRHLPHGDLRQDGHTHPPERLRFP